jgi:ribose-phosphate pyrophosphokinase
VSTPDSGIVQHRNPVVIDDIVSSGHTLAKTLLSLRALSTPAVTCVIVHALFSDGAESALRAAGANHVVSTNTVAHPTNAIDVVPELVVALRQFLTG